MTPVCVLLISVVVLAACATRVVTGHPPQVDLHALARDGQVITLDLNLRNVNDESLTLSQMDLRLELGDELLLHINQSLHLTVPARGRERVRVELAGGLAGLEVLGAVEQEGSRPWRLQGSLLNEHGRGMNVEAKGWLYPVPGRPGHFR